MSLPTPYYSDDAVTIYHGDCLDIIDVLEFDVVVTDPPYGISYKSGWSGDNVRSDTADRAVSIEGDEDTRLRDTVLEITDTKPALVFGSWKRRPPAGTVALLTWCKGMHSGMGNLAIPWKPNTEEVYVIGVGFSGHRGSSVLNYDAPVTWASRGRCHPHEKPVSLLIDLVAKCPPGVVLDPFMGSGTTLRAAKDLGRKAIGIEIDKRYCEIAARRMGQEVLDL